MARILLLTNTLGASAEVLPSLGLLQHHVRILPAEASVLIDIPDVDALFIDCRKEIASAKSLARLITSTGVSCPIIAIATEGGLSAISAHTQRRSRDVHSTSPSKSLNYLNI